MSKSTDDPGKDEKKKKGKKGGGGAAGGPSVATHPRASHSVRRAKGWGGIGGFAIAGYLSYKAGVPTFDVGLRAIAAGIAGYLLAWTCAVTVWRHLVLAELRALAERTGAIEKPDLIPARAPDAARPEEPTVQPAAAGPAS